MENFLILPGCDDTNRGDQALIWQTKAFAEQAGYVGQFYMLAEEENAHQSRSQGIRNVDYLLPHPSRYLNGTGDNLRYGPLLKLKWAAVSAACLLKCIPLRCRWTRWFGKLFCSKKDREALKIFSSARVAFVKGGGFLHASGGVAESYKIYFFLYHIRLAQSYGIPVYILPNSFGPLDAPLAKGMVRRALKKCVLVTTRESISQTFLRDTLGIQAHRFSDLGFHLEADKDLDVAATLKKQGIELKKGKSVALTMRPYRFPGLSNGEEKYRLYQKAMASFVQWLCGQGYYPVLVEHVWADLVHEQDMACIQEVCKLIPKECDYGVFSDLSLDCRQMKAVYGSFDYTVGTRFHSVIFSLAECVPSIALTYGGNKGTGIMNDLGLASFACPMEQITVEILSDMFTKLVNSSQKDILLYQKDSIAAEKMQLIKLLHGG